MNAMRAEDPHPDDTEAERLLALLADAMREHAAAQEAPAGETYAERANREQRIQNVRIEIDRLQQDLNALSYADPDAQRITHAPIEPRLPLLPGPPSWRTSPRTVTPYGSEGPSSEPKWRADADTIIARAVEEALAGLSANPSASRLTAMQVYEHHVARGEPLPDHAQELLARAIPVDPRSVVAAQRRVRIAAADEAGIGTKEIAAELGVDPRTVRLLRNSQTPDNAALLAAVAEGKDLRALRPAVAGALDLLDKKGHWRTDVLASTHGGTRNPNLIREAARVETKRRKAGNEPNNAKLIARAMRIDPRWVERWIARPDWEMAVTVEAVWLRGWQGTGLPRMVARVEAQRRLHGHPVNHAKQIAASLETPCPTDYRKVEQMIASPGWEHAVAAEHAEAVWLRGQLGTGRNPVADRD